MSNFKFEKEVLTTTRGTQSTKWDELYVHFVNPGDTLFFDKSEVSRAAASQCAKRMILLDAEKQGRKFHSGWHPIKEKTFIRVRPAGEVPDKKDEQEESNQEEE